jgi:hypothetical protein
MPENYNLPHQTAPEPAPAPLPEPEPVFENRAARARRVVRQDRARQARRREEMRQHGRPETHMSNAAVTEALNFVTASRILTGEFTPEVERFVAEVAAAARLVLIEDKGCEPEAAGQAVTRRFRRRAEHVRGLGALRLPRRQRQD